MLIAHSLPLIHLKNDGVIFVDYAKSLWLDASSYANFLQALQTAFSYFPFLADVVRNHFIPDTNLEEAFFLAREMGMPTQEDHILNQ